MSKKGFTYTLQIDAEINDLIAKTNQVKKSMESVIAAGKAPGAEKLFGTIERAIDRLYQKAAQPIESVAAFSGIQKEATAVGVALGKLGNIIEGLGNLDLADKMDLLPSDLKKKIESASAALKTFEESTQKAVQKSKDLTDAEIDLAAAKRELSKAEGKVTEKKQLITIQESAVETAQKEADAIKAKKEALEKFLKTQAAYEAAGGDKRKAGGGKKELEGMNLPADRKAAATVMPGLDLKDAKAVQAAIAQLGTEYSQASKKVTDAEATQRRYTKSLGEWENRAQVARGTVSNLESTVAQLNAEFEKDKAKNIQAAYTQLRNEAGRLGVDLSNIPLDYTEQNFNELNNVMNQLVADGIADIDAGLDTIQNEMGETGVSADNLGTRMAGAATDVNKLDAQVSQTQAFTQRIAQFVGLQGGIEIARSAMRNAISTIKELDKAMTEMAVVTDLDVGDYWDQLPKHTERANALGMSIKSVYEAETLYYQQGLKTNEVVEMSTETLKMARIAGLSAEDATNKMTAALRGFNMELNETSAQRIADVYSELAAITASDVDEISSAMTKTASIAASAGMEFETTAAFLSQIIETTRESAETAGTAMKTVIARFQELKKDPAEVGEVDGEIVDANKIETALRSVGVALRDSSGQFRELDEVFLELSSKWADLDTNTQRYIATIAAGSRQQSRFIAMMSDYSRTQELVTAANTSAGASNEQFEKTMGSLESKLAELKNAWDSFTMGIMDSDILKMGIDLLTGLLTTINNITDAFGDFSGAAKIGLLVAALYLGDKALKVFTTSIKTGSTIFGAFGKVGSTAIQKLQKGFIGLKKQIAKLTGKKINVNFKPATVVTEQYNAALIKANEAEKMRKAATAGAQKDVVALATADKLAAEAEEEKTKAIYNYAAAQGLTTAQASASLALQAAGVSADIAEAAAVGGLTTAKRLEYQASMIAQGASATEIATRMTQIATLYAETGAEGANTAAKKTGIAAIWAKIVAGGAWIASAVKQTVVNIKLAISEWLACPPTIALALAILALVAAVGLVIVGIIALVGWFKKMAANSPEAKLEAAKEATEVAGEAAEKASEAYNNLADSFENLADKYDALDELTHGTREWRDAVKEINEEVLALIDEYPELAGLVKSEDGVLKIDIDSSEAQGVLDDYEKRSRKTASAEIASKISVLRKQTVVDYDNLSDMIQHKNLFLQEEVNPFSISKALADGLLVENEGQWQITSGSEKALEKLGLKAEDAIAFANALGDGTEELKKFGSGLNARMEQEKALYEAMALNAAQLVDTASMSKEQQKMIDVANNVNYIKTFSDEAKDGVTEETKDMKSDSDEYSAWAKKEAAALYGVDEDEIKVNDEGKVTIGSGDDKKSITRSEFEKQVAASRGAETAAKNLQKLPKAIASISGKLSKEGQGKAGEAFKKTYMAEEGKALARGDIEELKENKDELKTLYEELGDEEKEAFGNYKNFEKHINDSIRLGEEAFDTATKTLDKMGVAIEMNEKLTSEAAQGYADQLEYIMQGAGQAGVDKVNSALDSLAKTMTDEELNKFMGQLNAIDWKNMEDWEQLPERLEEIGLSLLGVELEKFIDVAQDTAGAIRNIDLEALNEQMLALQSLSSKIKSGEQDRNISSSDYEALTAAIPELTGQFQQTLNGEFVYLGSSILELISAIEANTDALLGESTKQLQNKVEAAQLMEDLATRGVWADDKTKVGNITEWKSWSEGHTAEAYLKTFIDQAIQKEIDLSQLGIDGLSNDTINNLDDMDEEQVNALMDSLVGVFNDLGKNSTSLLEKTVNSLSLVYQNRDATTNSMEATQYRKTLSEGGSLSEEEQVSMRASTNAIAAQANAAGVNIVDLNKYLSTLEKMNSLQEKLEKEEIDLSDFTQKYSSLTKEAERFEREVVNKTNLKKMNSQLATTTETLAGLSEEFNNLQDEASKIETTAKMVEDFGIQVDESNYETVAGLIETMAAGGEAGYSALKSLLTMSGKAYSLTLMDMAKMTEDTWDDSTNKMSTRMQLFADAMVKTGMAMWSELEDGSRKFVWASKNNLFDALTKIDDSSETETWENPYDEIYNLNKKINAVIRERERLERNYERALNDSSKTAQELADITAGELKALKEEAILQKNTAEVARQYINYRQKDNARFSKYYTYDSETNVIQVDWEAVGKSGWDSDTSDEFKEFISYLEEQVDTIQSAEDSLEDIQDSVDDIESRGRDATSEIYDQVKEGLIKERQNQIDELQNINDSIQEAQSALVEQMQKQIDEARQARENDKTEEDITDKRTRLAYLQQDTSGAEALEIMALEKEIREAEEGYTDSLVDQALQKLQDANEKAAEQRQRQIDLAQLALNEYEESGKVWTDVKGLVDEGLKQVANGVPFVDTEAGKLALISEGINGLNPINKEDFYKELDKNAREGAIHQGFVSVTGEGKEGKTIAQLATAVTTAISTYADFGKIKPPIVNVTVNTDNNVDPETELIKQQAALDAVGYEYLDRETYERDTSMSARLRRDYYGTYEEYVADVYDLVIKQGKTPEFKTGGLADFTGPAWLDGTKSRPELVLNQTDTANFIALKDILADIFDNSNSLSKGNSKSGGDNYYDIEISVEKIGDDYDVDRLADRIKEIIYEDSVYRNVNAVNFMR